MENQTIQEIFSTEYRNKRFAEWQIRCEQLNMFPFALIMLDKSGGVMMLTQLQLEQAISETLLVLNKLKQASKTNNVIKLF